MSLAIRARWQLWWERRKKALAPPRPPLRARFKDWFERIRPQGVHASDAPREAEGIADRAETKVIRQSKLRQTFRDVQVLVRLVRAWARGDYRDISKGTIALILGALVYFLTPIDAIIDQIPLIGYLDDAAIIAWVISEVRGEIEAFKAWEAKRLLTAPPAPAALGPGPDSSSGTGTA
jgi:uncharacterized membrane protein YkvA (DUF1232 family)